MRARLIEGFLGHHAAQPDWSSFDAMHRETKATLWSIAGTRRDEGYRALRTCLLACAMAANRDLEAGRVEDAIEAYRRLITKVTTTYEDMSASTPRERHRLEFFSVVLALLHNNLADALQTRDAAASRPIDEMEKALEYQPGLAFLRHSFGDLLVRRRDWAGAEGRYNEAYSCDPGAESRVRHRSAIARLRLEHARAMHNEGDHHGAKETLRASLEELRVEPNDGTNRCHVLLAWAGETRGELARILDHEGRTHEAIGDFIGGAQYYDRAWRATTDADEKVAYASGAAHLLELAAERETRLGEHSAAIELLERGCAIHREAHGTDDPPLRAAALHAARLSAGVGMLHLLRGERDDGVEAINTAREMIRTRGGTSAPARDMVHGLQSMIRMSGGGRRLHAYFQTRILTSTGPREARDAIEAVRMLQTIHTADVSEPPEDAEHFADTVPMVTPLILEVEEGVIREAGGHEAAIDRFLPEMRERIRTAFGVTVPGVRLREVAEGGGATGFTILVNEVPRHRDRIHAGMRFSPTDLEAIERTGIDGTMPAPRASGIRGRWIPTTHEKAAVSAGLELWHPLEYPTRVLERTIEAHLADLVGHQEVWHLLETSGLVGPRGDDVIEKGSVASINPLTILVRSLLASRVPITDFPRIHELYRDLLRKDLPVWDMVERVRNDPAIRPGLWGNSDAWSHRRVGPGIASIIDASAVGADRQVLRLPADDAVRIRDAIADGIRGVEEVALVVQRQHQRPLLQAIVDAGLAELRPVPVLAMAELRVGLRPDLDATIDVV